MLFEEKAIRLKDGRNAVLRAPRAEDAAAMVQWLRDTSAETEFLLRCPEEVTMTAEQEVAFFERLAVSPDHMMIVCEVDGCIAGNCDISFNRRIKTRHRASVAIALAKEYWNLGIGTAMMSELIAAACAREGVEQLELEFIEGNARARALYEKMGFRVVGMRPDAFRLGDGSLRHEYVMQLKLR